MAALRKPVFFALKYHEKPVSNMFVASSYSSSIGTTTPCGVLACSTIVEPSQQEGFY